MLSLIRQGLTNEQIAERLGISESGARYHVSSILSKLGVATRAEAARWSGLREPGLPSLMPLLGRIQSALERIAHGAAVAAVSGGVLAVGLLVFGVFVVTQRGGGPDATAVPSETPEAADAPGPTIEELRMLTEEALNVALFQEPDELVTEPGQTEAGLDMNLVLIQVAWEPLTDRYTFRFTEKEPRHWFIVQGPLASAARWHVIRQDIPNLDQFRPVYTPLELANLQLSPGTALLAFQTQTGLRFREVFLDAVQIILQGSAVPAVQWVAFADESSGTVRCELPDSADPSDPLAIKCSGPAQAPPTAAP